MASKWQQQLRKSLLDLMQNGVTKTSVAQHTAAIRSALQAEVSDESLREIRRTLTSTYKSNKKRTIIKHNEQKRKAAIKDPAGVVVPVFSREQLDAKSQRLLDLKIQESLNLITLNRQQAVDKTIQRFQGFAASLPVQPPPVITYKTVRKETGEFRFTPKSDKEIALEARRTGQNPAYVTKFKKVPVYKDVKVRVKPSEDTASHKRLKDSKILEKLTEPVESLKYKERRVAVDQGHKLAAAINAVSAMSNGAVAYEWHQHHTQSPRVDHTHLSGEIFPLRESWAYQQGYIKGRAGQYKFAEDLPSQPAQEVNCRCTADYITSLRELYRRAPQLLTKKGLQLLGV